MEFISFRTAGHVQYFLRKYNMFPLRFNFFSLLFQTLSNDWSNTCQKRLRSAHEFFAVRAERCLEDAGSPSVSDVPSPAAGKLPLRNSNISFSEECFSRAVQIFSEESFSELPYSFKTFPQKGSKFCLEAIFDTCGLRPVASLRRPPPALGRCWGTSTCLGSVLRG